MRNDLTDDPAIKADPLLAQFVQIGTNARSYPLPLADLGGDRRQRHRRRRAEGAARARQDRRDLQGPRRAPDEEADATSCGPSRSAMTRQPSRALTPRRRRRRVGYAFVAPVFAVPRRGRRLPARRTRSGRACSACAASTRRSSASATTRRILTDDAFWHSLGVSFAFTASVRRAAHRARPRAGAAASTSCASRARRCASCS